MYKKGIILEIKEHYSIVMTDDSNIVRIKNKENMILGDTILFLEDDLYTKESTFKIKYLTPLIAVAAIFLFMFVNPLFKSEASPYSLVSLDINPSLHLELDANKNILSAKGVNKDGSALSLKQLQGLSLEGGVIKIKELLEAEGISLKTHKALVGFSFLSNSENPAYEEDIKNILSSTLNETKILYFKGSLTDLENAKAMGISLGRYKAEINIDVNDIEDKIESMTVEEIFKLLKGKEGIYLNKELQEELMDELDDRLDSEDQNEDEDDNNDDSQDIDEYNSKEESDDELDEDDSPEEEESHLKNSSEEDAEELKESPENTNSD